MKKIILVLFFIFVTDSIVLAADDGINFIPIQHATFVLTTAQVTIYVDPVGDINAFKNIQRPDVILITHLHPDHCGAALIRTLKQEKTLILGPKAVIDELKLGEIIKNGEKRVFKSIEIQAIPAYNTTKDRLEYHKKGEGNGYLIKFINTRVYISGDTEDVSEVRNLKNIDYAFICMNLPYTMSVEQAASLVSNTKPKVVIPYHYKGPKGPSDLDLFKKLVSKNKKIEVRLLNWYAGRK